MNKLLNRLKRIPNKLKRCIYVPETIFNKKNEAGAIVDISEWQGVYPDYFMASYGHIDCDAEFKKISQKLHIEKRILLTVREMWNIYNWVKKTAHLEGDIAEVGVFKGGSAKLIRETDKNKDLYLFDTFEGIPESKDPNDNIPVGNFTEGLEQVRKYLAEYEKLNFYKGIFPESAGGLDKNMKYSFVHLDVDIYSSTLDSLKYFYPKLAMGGVILTHDYRCIHAPGVKKAFDEFFQDKPETIVELWDSQALIIKI
jgi:O-methyltransferase